MLENFITRRDAYGKWVNNSWISIKNELTDDEIKRHEQGLITIGSYSISQDNTCNFVCWDIDNHGAGEAALNQKTAFAICEQLEAYGLYGLIEDSDGRGSFHVWLLFWEAIPSKTAYDLGCFIKNKFNIREAFPKQSKISENTPFGNLIRLPGKHHKHDHYSSFWIDTEWGELDKLMLSSGLDIPDFGFAKTPDQQRPLESKDTEWLRKYDGDFKTLDIVALCKDRYIGEGSGNHKIICPWADSHSDGKEEAFIWEATESRLPSFFCHHSHCSGKSIKDLLEVYPSANGACQSKFSKVLNITKENKENKDKPIKFRKWSELKNIAETQQEDWFIKGWSEFGTLTLFTGLPFSGKSTIISNLISSIANEKDFYSLAIQKCPILLFDFENKERILVNRIKKELDGNEGDIENLLYNVSREDCPRPLTIEHTEKCIELLSQQIEVIGKKGLLIIDTMRSAFAGGTYIENDPQSMINLLVPLKDLAYKTNWTIIVLHHNAKGSNKYSGSTAIAAVPDFLWNWTTDKVTGVGELSSEGRGDVMPNLNFQYNMENQRLQLIDGKPNDDDEDLILSFINKVGEVTEKDLKDEFKWGKNKLINHLKHLIFTKEIERKRDKNNQPFVYFPVLEVGAR